MRRTVLESELAKFSNHVHAENQLLINHIREQNEVIESLKNKIAELYVEIYEYEKETIDAILIDAPADENTKLMQPRKKCCAIM